MAAVIDADFSSHVHLMAVFETTFGSAVTVTDELGLVTNYEYTPSFDENMFVGTGHHSSIVHWRERELHGCTFTIHPQGGHAFGAILTNDSTGTAAQDVDGSDADDTRYDYLMLTSGVMDAYPSPFSLDVALEEGATDAIERYTSCYAKTASITIPATEAWTIELGCGAHDMVPTAAAQETFTQPTDEPFLGSKTSMSLAGNPVTNIENCVINVDERIREAFTSADDISMTDIHREGMGTGITASLSAIQIDREDYVENFNTRTEIGDFIITYDDSAATKKRMAKITLQDCLVTSCGNAVKTDNSIIMNDVTLMPTFDGTNDIFKCQYSTKTSGGYTGW